METTTNSVAEALEKAHVVLLADLRELEKAVRPAGEDLARLRTRLGAVRAHITEHFRFEEQNGYMDVISKREPRLGRTIHQLFEEHGQLRQALDALVAKAGAATAAGDTLRGEVREWIEHVRQHEAHENDLVQDAFCLDIGAED